MLESKNQFERFFILFFLNFIVLLMKRDLRHLKIFPKRNEEVEPGIPDPLRVNLWLWSKVSS